MFARRAPDGGVEGRSDGPGNGVDLVLEGGSGLPVGAVDKRFSLRPSEANCMRVVHVPASGEDPADGTVLASDVEVADSMLALARGLRFRSSIPPDYALVMQVGGDAPGARSTGAARSLVDMLFVPVPLDVVWLRAESVVKVATLRPWLGVGYARADTIVELPAGAAAGVEAGDTVRLEDGDGT